MKNLARLKLELSNKEYFSDVEFGIFLAENDLQQLDEYTIANKRQILTTVYDILQSLANNLELFCRIETEFTTTSEAISNLEKRIANVRQRINSIDAENGSEELNSTFSAMYYG